MRRRRLIIALAVLLLLAAVTTLLWAALDWPPPRLILKYGLPPAGGPTGRTWKNDLGMEFIQLSAGYTRVGSHERCRPRSLLARLQNEDGFGFKDDHLTRGMDCPPRWVQIQAPFYLAKTEVTNE